jgi:cell wall-associated NlpC family hydrolase
MQSKCVFGSIDLYWLLRWSRFSYSVMNFRNRTFWAILATFLGAAVQAKDASSQDSQLETARKTIQTLQEKLAPDRHLAIYDVSVDKRGDGLVISGEVTNPDARQETERALRSAGIASTNEITTLPAKDLEDQVWGISTLSVANGREEPEQKAELGTQVLMGHTFRVWKRSGRWFLAQTRDGYLSWVERGSVVRCTEKEAKAWENAPLLVVTAMEGQIFEAPNTSSQPVSDIVLGDLVKKVTEHGDWYQVQMPDERKGFVSKKAVEDYRHWKQTRKANPDLIEHTAKLFLGRPYLWGGNSPKGLDCSGLCKVVFFVNGIDLNRNASHQALQGAVVPLDPELSQLKKGDLIFFGHGRRDGGERRVSHVAIYLGDKTFIQSSQRVRISSLDPASPIYDEQYSHSLVSARRLLK